MDDCCDCDVCQPIECCGEVVSFSIIGVGLILLVVGALVFLGVRTLDNNNNQPGPRFQQRNSLILK